MPVEMLQKLQLDEHLYKWDNLTEKVTRRFSLYLATENWVIVGRIQSETIRATSRENQSLKVCDQVRLKQVCSASETS